ncbi:AAA family ATPase [Brassicibacter mesophilus]|uniref:AAA family ATPase n=1 Tax=Brassicibacter mesophilus TaxID=745119 RepID=UPI003D214CE4
MKPNQLKIIGLNSFLEEQVVNFSKLTEKGLFGIFGPTGSGKSTILDAMTLALYGQVARKSSMYINTETDKLYVCFEFEAGHGNERKNYRIERSLKKTNSGGTKTVSAKLITLDKDGGIDSVIEGRTSVEREIQDNVVGLNFEDFIRTVVLPQGKFSEFLTLTGADRNKMLERILGLEDYGDRLNIKVKMKRDIINNELNRLAGEFNRYDGVSDELLKQLKLEYEALIEKEKEVKKKKLQLEDKYENSKKIWELQKEVNECKNKETDLKKLEDYMKEKKIRLVKGKNAFNVIPYVNGLKKTQDDIKANKELIVKHQCEIELLMNKMQNTEKEYSTALDRKEKEIPLLIEKKLELNHAIDLVKEKESLENERNILLSKYKEYEKKLKTDEENLKIVIERKTTLEKEIEEKEELIKNNTVTSEYRKKVNEASDLEKQYVSVLKNKQEYENTINRLKNNVGIYNKEISEIQKRKEEKTIEIEKVSTAIIELEKNKPDDNKDMSKLQMRVFELSNMIQEYKESEKKLIALNNQKSSLCDEIKKSESFLNELNNGLASKIHTQENVKKDIKELEYKNIASILSIQLVDDEPCPVCGSLHHPNIAEKLKNNELDSKQNMLLQIDKEIIELQKKTSVKESDHKMLVNELQRLETDIEDKIKIINGLDFEELVKEKENLEYRINMFQKYREKWSKDYKETYDRLLKSKEERNQIDNTNIEYLTNLKKDKELLEETEEKLSILLQEINTISKNYELVKKELKLESVAEELARINKADREIEKLNLQVKQLREENKKCELEKSQFENMINKNNEEMKIIINSGKEKRRIIDTYQSSIEKIAGQNNPMELKQETEKLINEINDSELALRTALEKEKSIISKLQEEKIGIEKIITSLEVSIADTQSRLTVSLEENDFNNIDEVLQYSESREKLNIIEVEIKKYEDELNSVVSNIARINNELEGISLKEEEWYLLLSEREEVQKSHSYILKEVGQKKERMDEMQKNLAEVKRLSVEIKKLEQKKDMLTEILDLTKAKRFVEFVSKSHLRYIAKAATEKLKEITRERYGLEIDSNNNFMIVDNYNGGVKRECNSLSGGETFLTSLSLALALSSKIQLKGNTSIEFFFLDEGFGTLDTSLLDVVMSSLERLYKEELSVGIISHVEELKNRVPVKLIVAPPIAGVRGTTVKIEYS